MKKFLLITAILFWGCGKSDNTDIKTIYPLPYFPVYPGSWWKYVDGSGDTIIFRTDNEYQLDSYKSFALNEGYTDPVKVPILEGRPIYGYSSPKRVYPSTSGNSGLTQCGYLSEHTGDYLPILSSPVDAVWREVGNTDTVITVKGVEYHHVIRVNEYIESSLQGLPKTILETDYYAKDVGLIKVSFVDDSLSDRELIEYYINH